MRDIRFSAVVVTFNEADLLEDCLESLHFCDEIIVVDLGSTDGSVQVAEEVGAKVYHHERVIYAALATKFGVSKACNDWIIRLDPDERFADPLITQVREAIRDKPNAGIITVPYQYYFRGDPLTVTRWGIFSQNSRVFHKRRTTLHDLAHSALHLIKGYDKIAIARDGDNFIRHYWMQNYRQLVEKH